MAWPRAALDLPPIASVGDRGVIPLSYQQTQWWRLERSGKFGVRLVDGLVVPVNMYAAVRVAGRLARTRVQWALDEILRRHEALRSRILAVGDGWMQEVITPRQVELEIVDLRRARSSQAEDLSAAAAGTVLRPFDFASGPLLRGCLIRLDEDDQVVIAVVPHLTSDAWSVQVLHDELMTLLETEPGAPPPLPELDVQYGDFVLWQREWLNGPAREAVLDYYVSRIATASPVRLPVDHGDPDALSFDAEVHTFELPPELGMAIEALALGQQVSPFMVLLAAYGVVLARWSGQDDIPIIQPFSGRPEPELFPLIGLFSNGHVIRVDVSGNPTFASVLQRTKESVLVADEYQCVPYRFLEELAAARGERLGGFMVSCNSLVTTPPTTCRDGRPSTVRCARYDVDLARGGARFLINGLSLWTDGMRTGRLMLLYRKILFERDTVERFAAEVRHTLEKIVADPRRHVDELASAGTAESLGTSKHYG